MKYEAEIIKDIVDSRGHTKTSIHYQSECVEKWVKEVEGSYPKLCDYQPEWLNYSAENKIGVFPYHTLTDVTSASVENVVPYAYKRAILKGNTKYRDIDTGDILDTFDETKNLDLVSVRMPVLTTTGKNLFDVDNILYNTWVDSSNPDNVGNGNTRNVLDFTKVKPNQKIIASGLRITGAYGYDANKKFIEDISANIITTGVIIPPNVYYIRLTFDNTVDFSNAQLEYGSTSTTYEPYKSNILSTPSDLEHRGNGEVRDTLNCLTGELTQRLNEIVIDGTVESTINKHQPSNSELLTFRLGNVANDGIVNIQSMSDKLSWNNASGLLNYPYSFRLAPYGNPAITCLFICLPKSILSEESANGLMEWLANNPVKIQYSLATPVVKTVDLSVVDQDGKSLKQIKPIEGTMHLSTSGETIKPLFSGEIPVEAITQNLASFIEGE